MMTLTQIQPSPTEVERLARRAGNLARQAYWFGEIRLLRALGRVRRALKSDRRQCPDDRRGRSFAEIQWSPKPWWCEQFYQIIRDERPTRLLEVGTSLGMTGLYVLAALTRNCHGHFFTIEQAPAKVSYARRLCAAFDDTRATCLEGASTSILPQLLASEPAFEWIFIDIDHRYESTIEHMALLADHVLPGGLLLFDDISLNEGMRRAWREIRDHAGFEWRTLHWHNRKTLEPRVGIGRRR
jgi:predicted O-methyltransferase YrrM